MIVGGYNVCAISFVALSIVPLASSLSAACRKMQRRYQNMLGDNFDCSCKDLLLNELTTCKQKCMTCHPSVEFCTEATHSFKTAECIFFWCSDDIDLTNLATDVKIINPATGQTTSVKSTVYMSDELCAVDVFGGAKECRSCDVKIPSDSNVNSNPEKKIRINLDCTNIPGQGKVGCKSGPSFQPGPEEIIGLSLAGLPLNCIDLDDDTKDVCSSDPLPWDKPTPRPTKRPTQSPTEAPTESKGCSKEIDALNKCASKASGWGGGSCWTSPTIEDCDDLRKAQCHLDLSSSFCPQYASFCPSSGAHFCPTYQDESCVDQYNDAKTCVDETPFAMTTSVNRQGGRQSGIPFWTGISDTIACPYPSKEECADIFACSSELASIKACLSSHVECQSCATFPDTFGNCQTVQHGMCALNDHYSSQSSCGCFDYSSGVCATELALLNDCAMSMLPLILDAEKGQCNLDRDCIEVFAEAAGIETDGGGNNVLDDLVAEPTSVAEPTASPVGASKSDDESTAIPADSYDTEPTPSPVMQENPFQDASISSPPKDESALQPDQVQDSKIASIAKGTDANDSARCGIQLACSLVLVLTLLLFYIDLF